MLFSRTKKITGTLALVGVLVATAAIGFAQHEHGGMGGKRGGFANRGGAGRLFSKLDLTDAQQAQIRTIAEHYEQSTAALRGQLRQSRKSDFDPLSGAAFDEAAVRQTVQSRMAAQVELEVAHARMLSEMYAVMTPEQKSRLAERRQ